MKGDKCMRWSLELLDLAKLLVAGGWTLRISPGHNPSMSRIDGRGCRDEIYAELTVVCTCTGAGMDRGGLLPWDHGRRYQPAQMRSVRSTLRMRHKGRLHVLYPLYAHPYLWSSHDALNLNGGQEHGAVDHRCLITVDICTQISVAVETRMKENQLTLGSVYSLPFVPPSEFAHQLSRSRLTWSSANPQ